MALAVVSGGRFGGDWRAWAAWGLGARTWQAKQHKVLVRPVHYLLLDVPVLNFVQHNEFEQLHSHVTIDFHFGHY